VLGSGLVASAAGLAAALGAGLALRRRLQTSRACQRCNALMCGRCHGPAVRGLCATCDRLAHADNADPSLRAARAQALAARRERGERTWLAAGVVLPGLAWLRAGRPALALASCLAAAGAAAFALGRHGPVPDPLAAGAAGPALLLAAAVASGVVYAGLLAGAVAALRSR
jgi:hypothetical protein